jgi:hypothetical protein
MARRTKPQSTAQKKTVGRVMHEFKHGELESNRGGKVRNRRQAIAIALNEAGASNQQTPKQNRRQLARTKSKERRGETAQAQKEGTRGRPKDAGSSRPVRSTARSTARATARAGGARRGGAGGAGPTRAELLSKAARKGVRGRSRMTKAELQKALR